METTFAAKTENGVQCLLCPHVCKLQEGMWGKCGARQNVNSRIIAKNYGRVAAMAMDPIEKKPLYHFFPGRQILSIGTFGCNFKCAFCQNWQLAHGGEKGKFLTPKQVAGVSLNSEEKNNVGLAYTYSEPLMWYEFVKDTAEEIKKQNLQNVLVTNGFINPRPLENILPLIDAANIDLKSFNDNFYKNIVGGELKTVLNNILRFKKAGVHVELTFLMVTSLNDSYQEIAGMIKWIKEEAGKDTPLHISRYFPNYQLDMPATPLERLEMAYEIAKKELPYVYLGNVDIKNSQDTFCPACGQLLIKRNFYFTSIMTLDNGLCNKCGQKIPGRFE